MKTIPQHATQRHVRQPLRSSLSLALGLAVAGLSCAVNAATTFPDHPLQTSAGAVPPNIMFILDNSGSMLFDFMQTEANTQHNDYAEYWRLRRWVAGRSISRYRTNDMVQEWIYSTATSGEQFREAMGFFRRSAHGLNALAYDPNKRYLPWRRVDGTYETIGTTVDSVSANNNWHNIAVSVINLCGHTQSHFFVPKRSLTTATELDDRRNYWRYELSDQASGCNWVRTEFNAGSRTWGSPVAATPPGLAGMDQKTNYATWYTYHRTRMKVAKAGAFEAFYGLGENYRVGYDTLSNRADSSIRSTIQMPLPLATDNGLFRGNNKQEWFRHLYNEAGVGSTPLRPALDRTGRYYQTAHPWTTNGSGEELSCRRSYAILTTDGYWNSGNPVNGRDNTDGTAMANYTPTMPYMDNYSGTLADIAMYYWQNDLRPAVANNVSPTANNPASWQHMVTFGISIGLRGTLTPDNATLAQLRNGTLQWPDPMQTEDARRIDDLWHAAVNGRGEFVVASDANAFATALKNALDAIAAENAAGGGLGDTGRAVGAGSHIYMGSYVSGSWLGDVLAYDFSSGQVSGTPLWSFANQSVATPDAFKNRPIFTSTAGGTGAALAMGVLSPAAQAALGARTTGPAAVSAADNLAYIRGEQGREKQNGGNLRDRATLVGDIVNSVPVAHGGALFVGANDGMLHAINAADGTALFSYMPRGLDFAALAELSNPDYMHKFHVDGELHISTTGDGHGKNILVGALGRGGRGLFALDVTNPSSFAAGNVLWDNTGGVHSDDGYILDKPLVLRSNAAGKTVVVTANGVESAAGQARVQFYVLNGSGQVETRVSLGQTTGTGNGMTAIAAVDVDENGTVDYVYGGDMQGNVWKVDVTAATPASWQVQHGANTPMFTATDSSGARQPITGGFSVSREPGTGRLFVSFGTGRYLSEADKGTSATQTLYALVDDDAVISGRGQLQQRTLPYSATLPSGQLARGAERYSALPVGMRGWYLDLGTPVAQMAGERIVSAPEVSGRTLGVTTLIPGSGQGCSADANGTFLLLDAFTGTNPQSSGASSGFLDLDGDGQADRVPGAPSGEGHVSSISTGTGMGGAQFYLRPDGSLALAAGGFNASIQQVGLLPGSSGGGRLNWRELISEN